jgi:prepilin-type N-terminal cleavage/methylation domain-containing protein
MRRTLLHDKAEAAMPDRRVRAFTLIELLVVITVIVVLLGLLFPAFQGVQNQAKKTQAKNDLTQIMTAVNAFYTEYGKYPTSASSDAMAKYGAGNSNTNDALFNELRATGTFTLNTRQIIFLSPPDAKDQRNPRAGIKISNGQYFDPWGTAYAVAIDADYDNVVTPNPYGGSGGAGADPIRQGVIAWSLGKDAVLGDKTKADGRFSGSDDVISWQ